MKRIEVPNESAHVSDNCSDETIDILIKMSGIAYKAAGNLQIMNTKRAIVVLELHNKWRKGAEITMQKPSEIGEAIEIAINLMKGFKPKLKTK